MKSFAYLFFILILVACEAPPPPQETSLPQSSPKTTEELLVNCVGCHGQEGDWRMNDAPYIGGQRQVYLVNALNDYQQGKRKHDVMNQIVQSLLPEEIERLATYYAEQNGVDWQGAGKGLPPTIAAVNNKVVEAGRKRSSSCAACHGQKGISQRSSVPSLAGLPADYIAKAIHEYNKGIRENPLMLVYKDALSEEAINELAVYYSQLPNKHFKKGGNASRLKRARDLAQSCAGCHGAKGTSYLPSVPNLAGQDEEYLLKALIDYQHGTRKEPVMQMAVEGLKQSALKDLAYFYSRQRPEFIEFGVISLGDQFNPVGDGEALAGSCNGCHGLRPNSPKPGVPHLAGLEGDYLFDAMKAYQDGRRNHEQMAALLEPFAESDLEKLSIYYALQAPPEIAEPQVVPVACAACHGENRPERTPDLAGQNSEYLVAAMNAYRDGTRDNSTMKNAVEGLTEDEVIEIAKAFSNVKPTPMKPKIPQPPIALAEKCDRCHGDKSEGGVRPSVPIIQGQVEAYLLNALQAYKTGLREQSTMHAMAAALSPLETKAIARHYAEQ